MLVAVSLVPTTNNKNSINNLANYAVTAAWCICSACKSCVIHAERFRSGVIHLRHYTNGIPLPFYLYHLVGGSVVERRSQTSELSLVCTGPAADHADG